MIDVCYITVFALIWWLATTTYCIQRDSRPSAFVSNNNSAVLGEAHVQLIAQGLQRAAMPTQHKGYADVALIYSLNLNTQTKSTAFPINVSMLIKCFLGEIPTRGRQCLANAIGNGPMA